MNRVPLVDRNATTADRKALLDSVHIAFGATPNMFRAVANSPAALKSMWSAFGALGSGVIATKLGEQIAVAVADRNSCDYCLGRPTPPWAARPAPAPKRCTTPKPVSLPMQ